MTVEFKVGDKVHVSRELVVWAGETDAPQRLVPEIPLVVVRVNRRSIQVKRDDADSSETYWVLDCNLDALDSPATPATPEVERIPADHPGLAWLWTEIHEYASERSFCSEYDLLTEHFGIPAREQLWSVDLERGDEWLSCRILAPSQEAAEDMLRTALGWPREADPA